MFRSSNPALSRPEFQPAQTWDDLGSTGQSTGVVAQAKSAASNVMTIGGTTTKTLFLIAIVFAVTAVGWGFAIDMAPVAMETVSPDGSVIALPGEYEKAFLSPAGWGMLIAGAIGSMVLGLVLFFAPKASPVLAPLVAVFEGGFVCGISAMYASMFGSPIEIGSGNTDGALDVALVLNAAMLTFCIAGATCALYGFKIVRPGRLFYTMTIAGTLGICLFGVSAFLGSLILGGDSVFGSMLSMYDPTNASLLSIGFSLFVVVLASMNLVLDYDQVNMLAKDGAPKYMEWYGGYAILVTLVWLYINVLKLLAKLQSRE